MKILGLLLVLTFAKSQYAIQQSSSVGKAEITVSATVNPSVMKPSKKKK